MTTAHLNVAGIPEGDYEITVKDTPEGDASVAVFAEGCWSMGYGPDFDTALAAAAAEASVLFDPAPAAESAEAPAEPGVAIETPDMADYLFDFELNLGAGILAPTGGLLDA